MHTHSLSLSHTHTHTHTITLSQPEWYLTQVSTWITDHTHFLDSELQPLLHGTPFSETDARVGAGAKSAVAAPHLHVHAHADICDIGVIRSLPFIS